MLPALACGTGRAPPAGETMGDLLRSDRLRSEIDAQCLRNTGAVGGIRLGAVGDVALLNVLRGAANLTGGIVEQRLLLRRRHLAEEIARLLPMIVVDTMVPVRGRSFD